MKIISSISALQLGSLIVVAMFLCVGFVNAQWANPTSLPPGGNPMPPINVSSTAQAKDGDLSVGSITNRSASGVNPLGLIVSGSQRIEGWLKVGDGAVANPTQLLDLVGVSGTDGIKFPDGSVQTGALPAGATLIFNLGSCPSGWSGSSLSAPAPGHIYCSKN
jgi:hypothetical protein